MLSKIKFLLLCSVVIFSMASCSDDDDDDNGGGSAAKDVRQELVGTWDGYKFEIVTPDGLINEQQFLTMLKPEYQNEETLDIFRKQYVYVESFDESQEENPFLLDFKIGLTDGSFLTAAGVLEKSDDDALKGVFDMSNINIKDFNNNLFKEQDIVYDAENSEVSVETDFSGMIPGATIKTYYRISTASSASMPVYVGYSKMKSFLK